jgi:hypothetical protein
MSMNDPIDGVRALDRSEKKRGTVVAFGGRMGCGKDTAADLLVELASEHKVPFTNMRFAGKLRECVAVLTKGVITPEQTLTSADKAKPIPPGAFGETMGALMGRMLDVMEFALGQEVCLVPPNTVPWKEGAVPLQEDTLRKAMSIVTGNQYTRATCVRTEVKISPEITVGRLLQLLGTDVGRNLLNESIWISALERDWRDLGYPNIAIRDLRFPDEFAFVERIGGMTFLVDADKRLAGGDSKMGADGRTVAHASETSLAAIPREKFTAVIPNNGTLADLKAAVKTLAWTAVGARIHS